MSGSAPARGRLKPGIHSSILTSHRAHDYKFLIKRWRAVARAAGLSMRRYSEVGGYPVYVVRSKHLPASGGIYISAGIHGDEPGATEGCVAWAEKNLRTLARIPVMIFPCLNPWGLVNNSRHDDQRRDLNRSFQHEEIESLRVQKEVMKPFRFALALALHEDYDGQGVYIYEVKSADSWGRELLKIAGRILPIDGRARVDGRVFKQGVFQRAFNAKLFKVFEKMGLPEAGYLYLHHAARTFTIETPSEFALDQRVAAQVAMIEECVRRVEALPPAKRDGNATRAPGTRSARPRPIRKNSKDPRG